MIGQPIPPEREAWEHDQIEEMRRRMELLQSVRLAVRSALIIIGFSAALGVAAIAYRFLS